MRPDEIKKGVKVKIPTRKSTGNFSLGSFLLALNVTNVHNQDHLYIEFYSPTNGVYLSLNPDGSSRTVNGYSIDTYTFRAEDLDAYDEPKIDRDDIKPTVDYIAGQRIDLKNPESSVELLERVNEEVNEFVLGDQLERDINKDIEYLTDIRDRGKDTTHSVEEVADKIGISQKDKEEFKEAVDYAISKCELSKVSEKENKGLRYNEGKLDYTLMDLTAFSPMIEVLEFGAKKYSRDNWKAGGEKWGILGILGSLLRHVALLMSGQLVDSESGISHVGHIQCNAMFLGYFWNKHLSDKKSKKKSNFLKDLPKQK